MKTLVHIIIFATLGAFPAESLAQQVQFGIFTPDEEPVKFTVVRKNGNLKSNNGFVTIDLAQDDDPIVFKFDNALTLRLFEKALCDSVRLWGNPAFDDGQKKPESVLSVSFKDGCNCSYIDSQVNSRKETVLHVDTSLLNKRISKFYLSRTKVVHHFPKDFELKG